MGRVPQERPRLLRAPRESVLAAWHQAGPVTLAGAWEILATRSRFGSLAAKAWPSEHTLAGVRVGTLARMLSRTPAKDRALLQELWSESRTPAVDSGTHVQRGAQMETTQPVCKLWVGRRLGRERK